MTPPTKRPIERPIKRPIKRMLDATAVDEAMVQRVWRGVDSRRLRSTTRPRVWSFAAVGVAAAAAFFLWPQDISEAVPGPIHVASSAILDGDISRPVTLEEGSRIVPTSGSVVSILENGPTAVTALVSEGRARFEITPGGARRWTLECGLAQVEVVGTVFTIHRSDRRVSVSVERGIVLVRSAHLAEGVVRVQAGESVSVDAPAATTPATVERRLEPPSDSPTAPELDPAAAAESTRRPNLTPSIAERLEQADAARDAGHPARAEALLLAALAERPDDAQRGLAWTTIGRLRLRLGRAGAAGDALGRALEEELPGALIEEVMVRRVEAYARAGRTEDAQAAADAFAARFPDSSRQGAVRAWLEE